MQNRNNTFEVVCPHCGEQQKKQVIADIGTKFCAIGVRKCEHGSDLNPKGCGEDFVIYARSVIEVKTKKVVE